MESLDFKDWPERALGAACIGFTPGLPAYFRAFTGFLTLAVIIIQR